MDWMPSRFRFGSALWAFLLLSIPGFATAVAAQDCGDGAAINWSFRCNVTKNSFDEYVWIFNRIKTITVCASFNNRGGLNASAVTVSYSDSDGHQSTPISLFDTVHFEAHFEGWLTWTGKVPRRDTHFSSETTMEGKLSLPNTDAVSGVYGETLTADGKILGSIEARCTRTDPAADKAQHTAPAANTAAAYEPRRGSKERAAIMDAVRPEAAKYLGNPIQFIVTELRVAGEQAYANLKAQRPSGVKINLKDTPWGRGPSYSAPIDYPGILAILRRIDGKWAVVDHVFSSTDAAFAEEKYCRAWRAVLPKAWCR